MSVYALRRNLWLSRATLRAPIIRAASAPPLPLGTRSATTIVEPAFWKSLVPKPFRRSNGPKEAKPASKEWNPATFFIVIFLLIGSMSINLISVKQDYATFVRQSDAKIGLLREVVRKLGEGEPVDVERLLGTGDPERELEWEQALKEIERKEKVVPPRNRRSNAATAAKSSPDAKENTVKAEPAAKEAPPDTGRATFF